MSAASPLTRQKLSAGSAVAAVLLALTGCVGHAGDGDGDGDVTLTVLAAASLSGTFEELAGRFEADHPECFASEDHGATPAEYVLVALGSCLTAGVAAVAQNREIQLRKVTATVAPTPFFDPERKRKP